MHVFRDLYGILDKHKVRWLAWWLKMCTTNFWTVRGHLEDVNDAHEKKNRPKPVTLLKSRILNRLGCLFCFHPHLNQGHSHTWPFLRVAVDTHQPLSFLPFFISSWWRPNRFSSSERCSSQVQQLQGSCCSGERIYRWTTSPPTNELKFKLGDRTFDLDKPGTWWSWISVRSTQFGGSLSFAKDATNKSDCSWRLSWLQWL